jgi:hypothetical protein
MTGKADIAASVAARLLNRAKETGTTGPEPVESPPAGAAAVVRGFDRP